MPRHRHDRERDEQRHYERYLEYRYQQEEEEEEEEEAERWYEEQERLAADPVHQIKLRLAACVGGTRESRVAGLVSLLEYILTVPNFVMKHDNFRETACTKAREFGAEEPALADVCQRVLAAYATPRG